MYSSREKVYNDTIFTDTILMDINESAFMQCTFINVDVDGVVKNSEFVRCMFLDTNFKNGTENVHFHDCTFEYTFEKIYICEM